MIWIANIKTVPPPELRHDVSLQDNDGWSCAMMWKYSIGEPVPPELL